MLREYSEFVTRIRRYAAGETAIEEAVDRAVTECIAEGILADFLRSQRAESVILALEMRGHVSEQLRERIFEERDVSLLEDWLRLAIEEDTIEAFMEKAEMKKI